MFAQFRRWKIHMGPKTQISSSTWHEFMPSFSSICQFRKLVSCMSSLALLFTYALERNSLQLLSIFFELVAFMLSNKSQHSCKGLRGVKEKKDIVVEEGDMKGVCNTKEFTCWKKTTLEWAFYGDWHNPKESNIQLFEEEFVWKFLV